MSKIRINILWQGLYAEKRYGHWQDGLYKALKLLESDYDIKYLEPSHPDIADCDVILYWESLCTMAGKDRDNYTRVQKQQVPKILLFAGGPIKPEWCDGFDLFLVESKINEEEFEAIGKPWLRAFGVDTDLMKPEQQPKVFDGIMPGTCASWKRQSLFARALKDKGVICGRFQESDPIGFINARKEGTLVFDEVPYKTLNTLYNSSWCCVNTSEFWGGGQRITLEAMAAGIPVIVMADSPKNIEYVAESGAGLIVEPNEQDIRKGIEEIKKWTPEQRARGRVYVESKFTASHYAKAINNAIIKVLYEKKNPVE